MHAFKALFSLCETPEWLSELGNVTWEERVSKPCEHNQKQFNQPFLNELMRLSFIRPQSEYR